METFFRVSIEKTVKLFKSYYVVWKLAEGTDIFQGDVWFKSYYVVWKPFSSAAARIAIIRLNRTM